MNSESPTSCFSSEHAPEPAAALSMATQMAALGHPARIAIMCHLAGRECCCKEVVGKLDLAQSTVSQHLKVLVEAGLVRCTPDRQRSRYAVDVSAVAALSEAMHDFLVPCCAAARPARD